MLSVVTGKQRAGKTYYCCLQIDEYLKNTNRPIFTNLPLNPDVLADYACGGKYRHPAKYEAYLKRIHLFKSFKLRARAEYPIFKASNPDYVTIHKQFLKHGKPLLIDQSRIREFWKVIEPNSIIFLDELYQWFNSSDMFNSSADVKELRKELLTYTRQHGHFKDDMYLVSHSQADLDIHIRRGIQRLFVISNSKYSNISNNDLLKGLKWPIQFFIVKAYEYGEKEYSDKYTYFPNKKIFKCYESFSAAETLGKGTAGSDAVNTDSGVDNKANFKNFFRQTMPFLTFLLITVICLVSGYVYASNNLFKSKTVIGGVKQKMQEPKLKPDDFHKVIFISPNTIVFDDQYKLNIGDKIHGCEVEKFCRDYALISHNGKSLRVSYSGLRLREKTQKDDKKTTIKTRQKPKR